jgi:hypothetical protein
MFDMRVVVTRSGTTPEVGGLYKMANPAEFFLAFLLVLIIHPIRNVLQSFLTDTLRSF